MTRREHYLANLAWKQHLREGWARNLIRSSWRSWIRHPFANTRYSFWNRVPHYPDWRMSDVTFGPVGHDGWADPEVGGWLVISCNRCGCQHSTSAGTVVVD